MCDDNLRTLKVTRTADRLHDEKEITEQVCLTDKHSGYLVNRSISGNIRLESKTPDPSNIDPTIMIRLTDAVKNYKNLDKKLTPRKYHEQAGVIDQNLFNANSNPRTPTPYPEISNLTERNIELAIINKKHKIIRRLDIMKEQAKKRFINDIEQIQENIQQNPKEMKETIEYLNQEYNNTINMINMNKDKVEKSCAELIKVDSTHKVSRKMFKVKKDIFSQFGNNELAKVILAPRILRSRTPSPSRADAMVEYNEKQKELLMQSKQKDIDIANNEQSITMHLNAATQKYIEATTQTLQEKKQMPTSERYRRQIQTDQSNTVNVARRAAMKETGSSSSVKIDPLISENASALRTMHRKPGALKLDNSEFDKTQQRAQRIIEARQKAKDRSQAYVRKSISQIKSTSNVVTSELKNAERAQQLIKNRERAVQSARLATQKISEARNCTGNKIFNYKPSTKLPQAKLAQESEEFKRVDRASQLAQIRIATKQQNRAATKPLIDHKFATQAKCAATRNLQRSLGFSTNKRDDSKTLSQQKNQRTRSLYVTTSKSSVQPELSDHQKKMERAKRVSEVRKLYQQKSVASVRGTKFPLNSSSEAKKTATNARNQFNLRKKPPVINDEIVQAEKARQAVQARKMASLQTQVDFHQTLLRNILDARLVETAKSANIRNLQQRTLEKPIEDIVQESLRAERAKKLAEARKLELERSQVAKEEEAALSAKTRDISNLMLSAKTDVEKRAERVKRMEQARKMAIERSITSMRSFFGSVQGSNSILKSAGSDRTLKQFIAGPEQDQQIKAMIARTSHEPIQQLKKLKTEIENRYTIIKDEAIAEIEASFRCFHDNKELQKNQITEAVDFLDLEKCTKLEIIGEIQNQFKRLDVQFIDKAKILQAESNQKKKYDSGIKFLYEELTEKKRLALKKGINELKNPCHLKKQEAKSTYPLESKLAEVYKFHGFSSTKTNELPRITLKMSKWTTSENILVQKEKILSCLENTIKETKNNKEFLENLLVPIKKVPSIVLNEPIQSGVFKDKKSANDKIMIVSKKQAKQLHLMKDFKTYPGDLLNMSNLEAENADDIFRMVMNEEHGLSYRKPQNDLVDALISSDAPKINIIGNAIERPTNEIVPVSIPTTIMNSRNVLIGDDIDITIKINNINLPKTNALVETLKDQVPKVFLNSTSDYIVDQAEIPMTVNSYAYETFFQVRGTSRPSWFPGYLSVMPNDKNVNLFLKNSPSEVLLEAWQKMKPNYEV